ncbi:unnamed protein product (macronuclear) [Paramecium tetraurelia]|uniref:Transmembrane protein n=1 Tax=Paramecium tetraurelia TaxID=5888 RepID=A0BZL6_PARTE|nr:uncharacterized protein GSPATT00005835001 [Paramecium tetraurelia]CAK63983.1 unnamed protein product [Paramecium tetraurelia]|eukprot:XP_001431381.1 hypothetical protein (macronuclear) [Paramecium tetraurelia strain d4-2]
MFNMNLNHPDRTLINILKNCPVYCIRYKSLVYIYNFEAKLAILVDVFFGLMPLYFIRQCQQQCSSSYFTNRICKAYFEAQILNSPNILLRSSSMHQMQDDYKQLSSFSNGEIFKTYFKLHFQVMYQKGFHEVFEASEHLKSMFVQLFQQASYAPQYNPEKQKDIHHIQDQLILLHVNLKSLQIQAQAHNVFFLIKFPVQFQKMSLNHYMCIILGSYHKFLLQFLSASYFSKQQFIHLQIHIECIIFHMLDIIINLRTESFDFYNENQKMQNIKVHQFQELHICITSNRCQNYMINAYQNIQQNFSRQKKQLLLSTSQPSRPFETKALFQIFIVNVIQDLNFLLVKINCSVKTRYQISRNTAQILLHNLQLNNYILPQRQFYCFQSNFSRKNNQQQNYTQRQKVMNIMIIAASRLSLQFCRTISINATQIEYNLNTCNQIVATSYKWFAAVKTLVILNWKYKRIWTQLFTHDK